MTASGPPSGQAALSAASVNASPDGHGAPTSAPSGPSPAVMPTYGRQDLVFERGEGAWLVTADGDRYLDLASGVAVNALGHAHPHLVAALTAQAGRLWHTSNLYRVEGQERVAERLVDMTFADRVFFCNSGAEACEGAIKTARRYHFVNGQPERWRRSAAMSPAGVPNGHCTRRRPCSSSTYTNALWDTSTTPSTVSTA